MKLWKEPDYLRCNACNSDLKLIGNPFKLKFVSILLVMLLPFLLPLIIESKILVIIITVVSAIGYYQLTPKYKKIIYNESNIDKG